MATAQDIIQASLQELGVYGGVETMSAADANLGLTALNLMLDTWSNENLMCFTIQQISKGLVVGQAQYTIGQSGTPDISAVRPTKIIQAFIRDAQQDDFPVEIYEQDRWDRIGLKTTTSQIASVLFYNPTYPNGTINLFPVPSDSSYSLYIDAYQQLADLASLTTPLSLPPGYQEAIQHNLAVRMQPYFNVKASAVIKELADKCVETLKIKNSRDMVVPFDPLIVARGSLRRNIYRDSQQ
jgi:hypothetical protein